jgi:quercetin dioxygenase-like cupin family protein
MDLLGKPFVPSDQIAYADGAVVSKTIIDKGVGNITLFSFDVGQGLSEHTSPFDAVVVVIHGSAAITIGEEKHIVQTGSMVIMPANKPHALKAEVRFKMMLIMIREKAKI